MMIFLLIVRKIIILRKKAKREINNRAKNGSPMKKKNAMMKNI